MSSAGARKTFFVFALAFSFFCGILLLKDICKGIIAMLLTAATFFFFFFGFSFFSLGFFGFGKMNTVMNRMR